MNRQKAIAFLLMTAVSGAVAYMSGRAAFPAVIWAVALLGLSGRLSLDVSRSTRLVAVLAATIAFVVVARIVPEDPKESYPLSALALTYIVAWYFMVLMAGAFFVRRRGPMPRTFPLYAIIALVCSGNVFVGHQQDRVYMLAAMAVTVLTAFYFAAERKYLPAAQGRELLWRRTAGFLVLLVALVVAGSASAFVYANQYRINQTISSLAARLYSGRLIGFSDQALLRSMMYLKTRGAEKTALRVYSRRPPGYLRGKAFVRPLRRRWYAAKGKTTLRPSERGFEGIPAPASGRNLFALGDGGLPRWEAIEIYPVKLWAKSVFCPHGTTVIAALVDELEMDECGAVTAPSALVGASYTAFVPARGKADKVSQEARESCAAVPADLDPDVHTLAENLFKDCRTTAEKIAAVEKHFTGNYEYHLGIRIPPGADPLTYFLLESPRPAAHCEFFAAGAALLLRLGGVPAYYATGFVVTERSDRGGYWIARNADAHAWVEACDDQGRWVTVEATPAAGIPSSLRRSDRYYLWDSLMFRLLRFVAMVRRDGPVGLGAWFLSRLADLARAMFTTSGGLIVSLCPAVLAGWLILRRLRRIRRQDPVMARLHRLLGRMDRRVRKLAPVRGRSETLAHFASRLQGQSPAKPPAGAAARWYLAYAAIRYGGRVDQEDAARLQRQMPLRARK